MPRGEMMRRMDSPELSEWQALYRIEKDESDREQTAARAEANMRRGLR